MPALALYRQNFQPSPWLERPHSMVAVSAICADTDERAQWLSDLLEPTAADELMLTTMVYDIEDRVRSFGLIAEKVAGSPR